MGRPQAKVKRVGQLPSGRYRAHLHRLCAVRWLTPTVTAIAHDLAQQAGRTAANQVQAPWLLIGLTGAGGVLAASLRGTGR